MIKRIIAVLAGMCMIYGSALIPAADTGGEPVKKAESSDFREPQELRIKYGPIRPVEVKSGTTERSEHQNDPVGEGLAGVPEEADQDVGADRNAADGLEEHQDEPAGESSEGEGGTGCEDDTYGEPFEVPENGGESAEVETQEEIPETNDENGTFCEDSETEWTYYGNCRITFYDAGPCCCGQWAYGPTASGVMPEINHTVAAGEDLPFGTEIMIDGQVYVVEDRGVSEGCIDIFVSNHDEALARGMYWTDVYVCWKE